MRLGQADLNMMNLSELIAKRDKIRGITDKNVLFWFDGDAVHGDVVCDAITLQIAYIKARQARTKGWEYEFLDMEEELAHMRHPADPMPYKPRTQQTFAQRSLDLLTDINNWLRDLVIAKREQKIRKIK